MHNTNAATTSQHHHRPSAAPILWVHDERFSPHDLILNADYFPHLRIGDFLELLQDHTGRRAVMLQVGELFSPGQQQHYKQTMQISIAQPIAQLFDFQARKEVFFRQVDPTTAVAEYMELNFRDQYIGRGDMFRLKNHLLGSAVYAGKKITFAGCIRAQIKEIYVNGMLSTSGYITPETKTIFRSESAKCFLFIQISREMFEFNQDGDLLVERATHGFLPELFQRWRQLGTNHVASIVLFGRVQYSREEIQRYHHVLNSDPAVRKPSKEANWYKDFFKVVVDWETRTDWLSILPNVKEEIQAFRYKVRRIRVKETLQSQPEPLTSLLSTESFFSTLRTFVEVAQVGEFSRAQEGNLLESINLAINIFDKHYIDRDLARTGLSIIIVTASPGFFVAEKRLLRLTEERMVEDGIGLDIVSLGKPPLHSVPLFQFQSSFPKSPMVGAGVSSSTTKPPPPSTTLPVPLPPTQKSSYTSSNGSLARGSPPTANTLSSFHDPDTWNPLLYDGDESEPTTFFQIPPWIDISYYFDMTSSSFLRCRINRAPPKPSAPPTIPDLNVNVMSAQDMDAFDSALSRSQRIDMQQPTSGVLLSASIPSLAETEATTVHPQDTPVSMSPRGINTIPISQSLPGTLRMTTMSGSSPPTYSSKRIQRGFAAGGSHADSNEAETSHALESSISASRKRTREVVDTLRAKASIPSALSKAVLGAPFEVEDSQTAYFSHKLIYPCKPTHNNAVQELLSHPRRWHHIFPRKRHQHAEEIVMKWTPLCSPACLPLTTDYFPTMEELAELYQEYTYTVSLNDDFSTGGRVQDPFRSQNLLLELISQRLVQGFQLILGNVMDAKPPTYVMSSSMVPTFDGKPSGASPVLFKSSISPRIQTSPPDGSLRSGNGGGGGVSVPFFLSMGQQVHRLVYDPAAQNVEVKRYVRNVEYSTDPISYTCAMWPKNMSDFIVRSATFSYPSSGNFNWNYLDQVIAGYQDELTESIRFWRTRFILIPLEAIPQSITQTLNPSNDLLNEEEIRLAGFMKFIELFHKARWISPEERSRPIHKKELHAGSNVPITFTTFQTSTYVANEVTAWKKAHEKQGGNALANNAIVLDGFTRDASLHAVAEAMVHPLTGLTFKDRRWHLRLYEKVFIGSECVDWLIHGFADINTREEAEEYGNALLANGVLEHVNKKHRFLDGHYFYRVNKAFLNGSVPPVLSSTASATTALPTPAEEKGKMRWFRSKVTGDAATAAQEDMPLVSEPDSPRPPKSMRRIELSRKILIDLDPQMKSYRRELAVLHYDTVYNPKNCYHFQLHWLICTARLVEDLLQSWGRVAEKCGLRLVEAPVEQTGEDGKDGAGSSNPFQSPISIQLATQPPSIDREKLSVQLPDLYFESELVKHFGFLLDMEGDNRFQSEHIHYSYPRTNYKYTQYVHRSGVAFIQLRERGKGFLWVNNRLLTSHLNYGTSANNAPLVKSMSTVGFSTAPNSVHPDMLRKQFEAFCGNAQELSRFWMEAASRVMMDKHALLDDVTDEAADAQLIINRGEEKQKGISGGAPLMAQSALMPPATLASIQPTTVVASTTVAQAPSPPIVKPDKGLGGFKSYENLLETMAAAKLANPPQSPATTPMPQKPFVIGALTSSEEPLMRRSRSFSTAITNLEMPLQLQTIATRARNRSNPGAIEGGSDGALQLNIAAAIKMVQPPETSPLSALLASPSQPPLSESSSPPKVLSTFPAVAERSGDGGVLEGTSGALLFPFERSNAMPIQGGRRGRAHSISFLESFQPATGTAEKSGDGQKSGLSGLSGLSGAGMDGEGEEEEAFLIKVMRQRNVEAAANQLQRQQGQDEQQQKAQEQHAVTIGEEQTVYDSSTDKHE